MVVVTDRGKVSLKKFAKLRSDDRVLKDVDQRDDCQVHENCRKWYNNRIRIDSGTKGLAEDKREGKVETRSSSS